MTYRFLIALATLTVLVATPLTADCWLDCDAAEEEAIAACDAFRDPVEYAQCVRWAMDDYYVCLDACEIGDEHSPSPGPWWPVDWNQGRCSVKAPGGLQTNASVRSSFTGASDSSGMSVALPSDQPDALATLASESLPEALRSQVSAMVRSVQVEAFRAPKQERSDQPAGDTGLRRVATVENLLEKPAPR